MFGIACDVFISGELIKPEALFTVSWTGVRGGWPPEHDWLKTDNFFWEA